MEIATNSVLAELVSSPHASSLPLERRSTHRPRRPAIWYADSVSLARPALFAALALVTACTLLVDTGDLAGVPAGEGGSSETGRPSETSTSAIEAGPSDAGADARSFPDAATVWTNGHAYEVVTENQGTWRAARAAAAARGGHLATIGSVEENVFVWSLCMLKGEDVAKPVGRGPYIGGFHPPDAVEPDGGWTWITGEPFAFTAWADREPNEGNQNQEEDAVAFYLGPNWADVSEVESMGSAYVVEYEP